MSDATDSILTSTKKLLGIAEDYEAFDLDIIVLINSALFTLNQLGLGPVNGYSIDDKTDTWDKFLGTNVNKYNGVKEYVYLAVRLVFDPPATSYVVTAFQDKLTELTWRLNVERESTEWIPEVMMTPNTKLVVTAGIPFARRIRVKDGKSLWNDLSAFEATLIVDSVDLSSYLATSFDLNDIVIDWSMSGQKTTMISSGTFRLVLSDPGLADVRAVKILDGYLEVSNG